MSVEESQLRVARPLLLRVAPGAAGLAVVALVLALAAVL